MSLRLRLNLLLAVLNLGFLAALTTLLIGNLKSSIHEEIEAAHRVTVQMLGSTAQISPLFGPAPRVMTDFLQRLGRVRANEIRLYSSDGVLRYASPPSIYKEGRAAPDWFAALMTPRLEATVIGLNGARLEVTPDASRAVLDAWDSMAAVYLIGLAFVALLHASLSWFLRRLLRPTEADQRRLAATTRALAENREVMRLIQAGIEEERKRLSRELHDELGQSVTAIRLIATSIARSGQPQGAEQISEIAAGLYDGVHRIVRELRPAVLDQPDLAAALGELAREWRARHRDIALELVLEGDCGDLGEAVTLSVFRSVQEAMTNVLKHADAHAVSIRVMRTDDGIEASIADDGRGVSGAAPGSRRGLAGMKERVAALGGTLEAGPDAAGGFRVRITVPLAGETF